MSDWITCNHCGKTGPGAEMINHRCGVFPHNRMVTESELSDRESTEPKRWPHSDPSELHRLHRAHIARRQSEAERMK